MKLLLAHGGAAICVFSFRVCTLHYSATRSTFLHAVLIHELLLLRVYIANALLVNDDCQTPLEVARAKGYGNVVRSIEVRVPLNFSYVISHLDAGAVDDIILNFCCFSHTESHQFVFGLDERILGAWISCCTGSNTCFQKSVSVVFYATFILPIVC